MNAQDLKDLRLRLKLSQRAMGERLGVSGTAVYKLEHGINRMSKPVEMLAGKLEKPLGGDAH